MVNFGKKIKYFLIHPKFYTLHFTFYTYELFRTRHRSCLPPWGKVAVKPTEEGCSPSVIQTEGSESFLFFLLFFPSPFFPFSPLPFSFHSPFSFLFLLSAFPFSPLAALFHVRLNCSARRIRFQVINIMWATAPLNLYFEGLKPPKYRKFRQSYQHFIVEILIFVEKCVTIDV